VWARIETGSSAENHTRVEQSASRRRTTADEAERNKAVIDEN